jgi:hypothetical protein
MANFVCPAMSSVGIPEPDQCQVSQWDIYGQAVIVPGNPTDGSGDVFDDVDITIRNLEGNVIPDALVEIVFEDCPNLCLDPVDPALSGFTNSAGQISLNPNAGGCNECTVLIRSEGIVIRVYPRVVSPDWDGTSADGQVDDFDLDYFMSGEDEFCKDLDGSGMVDALDLGHLVGTLGSHNPNGLCTPASVEDPGEIPARLMLHPTVPNPATRGFTYAFSLPRDGNVNVSVHDVSGRLVRTLLERNLPAGRHVFSWGLTGKLEGHPAGVYYLRLAAGGEHASRMFVLIRR